MFVSSPRGDEMLSEQELIQDVLAGNSASFAPLVTPHREQLLRLSARVVKDMRTAEEVVQEALMKAYEKLHMFSGTAPFKAWLNQIAVNTAKNRLRGKAPRDFADLQTMEIPGEESLENTLMERSAGQLLRKLVAALPDRQRTAVTLHVFDQMDFHEVARVMNCPYDTAKANYRHGIMALRRSMWTEI